MIRGIDQETIYKAFILRGIQTRTVLLPWQECLQWMDQEKADGVFQITPSEEREKLFLFSEKLRTERMSLFGRSSTLGKIQGGTDIRKKLAGRTVGVLEGYSYGPGIDDLVEAVTMKLDSQKNLFMALVDGQVDLVLMDSGVALCLAGEMSVSGIEQVGGYAIERPLHVAFQKRHQQLARLFNSGLHELKERALDKNIFKSYSLRSRGGHNVDGL